MCSNQSISCVPVRAFPVFQSEHFFCSNQSISCVPIRAFLVLQSEQFLCANQRISCVQSQHFFPLTSFWATKRLTDLEICPSEAKNLEEADFDVQKSLAPPKSTKNYEKPKKKTKKEIFAEFFFRKKIRRTNFFRSFFSVFRNFW